MRPNRFTIPVVIVTVILMGVTIGHLVAGSGQINRGSQFTLDNLLSSLLMENRSTEQAAEQIPTTGGTEEGRAATQTPQSEIAQDDQPEEDATASVPAPSRTPVEERPATRSSNSTLSTARATSEPTETATPPSPTSTATSTEVTVQATSPVPTRPPTATATPQPTSTPLPPPTNTPVPPPTNTPVPPPTNTPVPPPTNTPVPAPTSTPEPPPPTAASYAAPVLISPEDGATIYGPTSLRWDWDGTLAEDEYFDVRVWREGAPHYGIGWTTSREFFLQYLPEPGTYFWSVTVIRGRNGQWLADLSPEAPPRRLIIRRQDEQPTSPPPQTEPSPQPTAQPATATPEPPEPTPTRGSPGVEVSPTR